MLQTPSSDNTVGRQMSSMTEKTLCVYYEWDGVNKGQSKFTNNNPNTRLGRSETFITAINPPRLSHRVTNWWTGQVNKSFISVFLVTMCLFYLHEEKWSKNSFTTTDFCSVLREGERSIGRKPNIPRNSSFLGVLVRRATDLHLSTTWWESGSNLSRVPQFHL